MKSGNYYKFLEQRFNRMEELSIEELQELVDFHSMLKEYHHGSNSIHCYYHALEAERFSKVIFNRLNFD